MEVQYPEVLNSAAASPWKSNSCVDGSLVEQLHRGGGKVKKNSVTSTYKRSSEEAQDDTHSLSSSLLFVWSGQPNEDDDDDDDNQPSKRLKPLCTTFVNLNLNKDDGEGGNDEVVGWPPIESWRKKLLYQQHGPQQRHENTGRRARKKHRTPNNSN